MVNPYLHYIRLSFGPLKIYYVSKPIASLIVDGMNVGMYIFNTTGEGVKAENI